jgi:hypothetical protein
MKVVDAKDAKLKASLKGEGNCRNGCLANSREGKSCTKCDKSCSRYFELSSHVVKIHGNVKEYSCKICDKRSFIKWSLKKHSGSYETSSKRWKYFDEGTVCPLEDVIYKFLHDDHPEKLIRLFCV